MKCDSNSSAINNRTDLTNDYNVRFRWHFMHIRIFQYWRHDCTNISELPNATTECIPETDTALKPRFHTMWLPVRFGAGGPDAIRIHTDLVKISCTEYHYFWFRAKMRFVRKIVFQYFLNGHIAKCRTLPVTALSNRSYGLYLFLVHFKSICIF